MNKKLLLLTLSVFLLSPIWATAMEEDDTTQNKSQVPSEPAGEKYRLITEEERVHITREANIQVLMEEEGMSPEEAKALADAFY